MSAESEKNEKSEKNRKTTAYIGDSLNDYPILQPSNTDLLADGMVPWVVEFRVIGTPYIIKAPIGETLIIGRSDDAQSVRPEVDLSEYDGRRLGVSRRHARLVARDNRVTLEDLESSNGTFINGAALVPKKTYRVHDGNHIQLGKLELQINFVIKPTSHTETSVGLGDKLSVPRIGTGQTILVVDENEDVCHIIAYIGERSGFNVNVAHTLSDAVRYVDALPTQALITELFLPDGNGLDLIRYFSKNGHDGVPIVAMTGAAGGYNMSQAIDEGVEMFLTKPVAVDELIRSLGKIVELME